MTGVATDRGGSNDITVRETIWRRFAGNDWAAYDALPPVIRRRLQVHAYDAWSVNALILWRRFLRQTGSSRRAERRLLHHLDECEALERAAFGETFLRDHGLPLPHLAAGTSVLRGPKCGLHAADTTTRVEPLLPMSYQEYRTL